MQGWERTFPIVKDESTLIRTTTHQRKYKEIVSSPNNSGLRTLLSILTRHLTMVTYVGLAEVKHGSISSSRIMAKIGEKLK
jgi:hypothetical protein